MTRVEHPLIGINGVAAPGDTPKVALAHRYAEAVLKAGGIPLVLAPVGGPSDVGRMLDLLDGLLLSGGDDFDMERLGMGATHPAAQRTPPAKQDFDVLLARMALERRLPILGICYGMQLLALVQGGRLLQHLPEDRPGRREHRGGAIHPVTLAAGSKLARIVGVEQLDVVSRHHQAAASVGPGWSICARDDEGLIEAIERADHPFALGVQWHPELAPEGSPHDRLFRGLVGAAGVAAARRLTAAAAR
ncbi:MAG: gamma-glutamyl-gamma-aminobutyrate hydrolase family protein [Planctomycetes bacterium]|nr:gamma-glutamyl-gamma-aminobutyrate hydrolase family protein [Planctomycetota bacterium]